MMKFWESLNKNKQDAPADFAIISAFHITKETLRNRNSKLISETCNYAGAILREIWKKWWNRIFALLLHRVIGKFDLEKPECSKVDFLSEYEIWAENKKRTF